MKTTTAKVRPTASATVEQAAAFVQTLLDKHGIALKAKAHQPDRWCVYGYIMCEGKMFGESVYLIIRLYDRGVINVQTFGMNPVSLHQLASILPTGSDEEDFDLDSKMIKQLRRSTQRIDTEWAKTMQRLQEGIALWKKINSFIIELRSYIVQFKAITPKKSVKPTIPARDGFPQDCW